MNKETENPQAFPSSAVEGGYHYDGMTLRDYFAAKASDMPLWDFDVKMKDKRPKPNFGNPLEQKIDAENKKEIDEWDREYKAQRIKQWPYEYADVILKERSKS